MERWRCGGRETTFCETEKNFRRVTGNQNLWMTSGSTRSCLSTTTRQRELLISTRDSIAARPERFDQRQFLVAPDEREQRAIYVHLVEADAESATSCSGNS